MTPTFSIVMPTYKRPHTLPRAVASVLAQTYPHWELVVVNNDVEYPNVPVTPALQRILVVQHAEVTGASYARNRGLEYATGDLVCFFDDDDEAAPNWLQRFAETFAANPNAKAVRCGLVLPDGRPNPTSHATPCVCLRREFVTPTWEAGRPDQDARYFHGIFRANGWTREAGEIVDVPDILIRAHKDPKGGLRGGKL